MGRNGKLYKNVPDVSTVVGHPSDGRRFNTSYFLINLLTNITVRNKGTKITKQPPLSVMAFFGGFFYQKLDFGAISSTRSTN